MSRTHKRLKVTVCAPWSWRLGVERDASERIRIFQTLEAATNGASRCARYGGNHGDAAVSPSACLGRCDQAQTMLVQMISYRREAALNCIFLIHAPYSRTLGRETFCLFLDRLLGTASVNKRLYGSRLQDACTVLPGIFSIQAGYFQYPVRGRSPSPIVGSSTKSPPAGAGKTSIPVESRTMNIEAKQLAKEHLRLTRRYFLQIAGTGLAASLPALSDAQLHVDLLQAAAKLEYLTRDKDFGTVERGSPLPYTLPEDMLRQIGMTRDTWKLEVLPDLVTGTKVEAALSKERGTALDWGGLMKLAETRAVRYLKVMTCNNLNAPLGMGLWEGVPLREVVWMTRPVSDIRRVYYYGHHNEDAKQMFRSSLSLSRILEDPPGDYPVILAYKLNGELLSGRRGGPVRMLVPEAYGFKSVKWLQRVVLTDLQGANDTYADENNDVDSWMKTFARFLSYPEEVRAGAAIPMTGVAQVGISGLRSVQYWLNPVGTPLPTRDPNFATAPWRDAQILDPPLRWSGGLPDDRMPKDTLGFDLQTGKPKAWPMRYSIVHWAAVAKDVPTGKYELRCRTVDANGIAQPLPRPLPKSGVNFIEQVTVNVKRA